MAELQARRASAAPAVDLSQFYEIFFEEAAENAAQMEQMLLDLNLSSASDDDLNGIFRCAHSIKGGAATFGFTDVAELTHQMESLLDRLRRRELTPTGAMIDVLLEATDALCAQLASHQDNKTTPPPTADLVARISALASGQEAAPAPAAATPGRTLLITVGPVDNEGLPAVIAQLFHDIPGLGEFETLPSENAGMLRFRARTTASDEELIDLFSFHVAKNLIDIRPEAEEGAAAAAEAQPAPAPAAEDEGFGLFTDAPGLPGAAAPAVQAAPAPQPTTPPPARVEAQARQAAASPAAAEATTLRVAVSKVDQLINLVGELVITQAMLAQNSAGMDPVVHQKLLAGLANLDRNTRDLQESVMSVRMIPMSVVFSRFPRMLRDLASKLGKQVELVTHGDATELDKGLVEKITDPLTHLVRNSCDHGIEMPEERIARGKPAQGTITLTAGHQGGSVLIEVRDDGRGLSRAKLLAKAAERGLDVSEQMSDQEVWKLIFAPGFSTAAEVTEVSGRGVGMDVVMRNITALNGTVDIDSVEGVGMRVSVRLPLTLAIMDGMSVRVGREIYILPLSSVIESFQAGDSNVNTLAQGPSVVNVRSEYMPVVSLHEAFQVPGGDSEAGVMVVVEADGVRAALLVDELVGQHQVVVKNLEANYRKVPGVSGATILGDGKVALIVEPAGLVRRVRH